MTPGRLIPARAFRALVQRFLSERMKRREVARRLGYRAPKLAALYKHSAVRIGTWQRVKAYWLRLDAQEKD